MVQPLSWGNGCLVVIQRWFHFEFLRFITDVKARATYYLLFSNAFSNLLIPLFAAIGETVYMCVYSMKITEHHLYKSNFVYKQKQFYNRNI